MRRRLRGNATGHRQQSGLLALCR